MACSLLELLGFMGTFKQENYFIIMGTSGTGKTSLVAQLRDRGYQVHNEVTREILSEQLSIDGPALPSKAPLLFVQKMLDRAIAQHLESQLIEEPVFFDRGIPDIIAYAERFKVEPLGVEEAAEKYLYNRICFLCPPWKEIFVNDPQRGGSFEFYSDFHARLVSVYQRLNFEIIELPLVSVNERVDFILQKVN